MVSHELNDAHEGDDRADAAATRTITLASASIFVTAPPLRVRWVSPTHIGPGTFTNVLPLAFDRLERRVGRTAG
jgi:hypothetical protein